MTAASALQGAPGLAQRPCRFDGSPYRLTASRVHPPERGTEVSLSRCSPRPPSNNQCFAQIAVNSIGPAGMLAGIRRFGLLEVPVPAHAAGEADDPGEDEFALGRLGCGLAGCRITPLHAARLAGTLADGRLDAPHWLARVVDGSGRDLPLPAGAKSRRVLERQPRREHARDDGRDHRAAPRGAPSIRAAGR